MWKPAAEMQPNQEHGADTCGLCNAELTTTGPMLFSLD